MVGVDAITAVDMGTEPATPELKQLAAKLNLYLPSGTAEILLRHTFSWLAG